MCGILSNECKSMSQRFTENLDFFERKTQILKRDSRRTEVSGSDLEDSGGESAEVD